MKNVDKTKCEYRHNGGPKPICTNDNIRTGSIFVTDEICRNCLAARNFNRSIVDEKV
jgi:hypothetical protein